MRAPALPHAPGALSWPAPPSSLTPALSAWFHAHRRALPWRTGPDGGRPAYFVWLAEIMLQQTRVSVVVDYFERFVARFPTVHDLAAAREDDVLALWSGLGYYARGRNLHKAARVVVDEFAGVFPTSRAALLTLPGVGDYTAAAVASFSSNEAVAVLDGNVARVLARVADDDTAIDTPKGKAHFTARAQALVDVGVPAHVNEALMELGALVCTPKAPTCGACPWQEHCAGRARALTLPTKQKKKARTSVAVAAVVVVDDSGRRVWLERRASSGLFGGLWQPPCVELPDVDIDVANHSVNDENVVDGGGDDGAVVAAWAALLAERALPVPARFGPAVRVERTLTHRDLTFFVTTVSTSTSPTPPQATTLPATAQTDAQAEAQAQGQWCDDAGIAAVGTSTAVRAVLAAARSPRLL